MRWRRFTGVFVLAVTGCNDGSSGTAGSGQTGSVDAGAGSPACASAVASDESAAAVVNAARGNFFVHVGRFTDPVLGNTPAHDVEAIGDAAVACIVNHGASLAPQRVETPNGAGGLAPSYPKTANGWLQLSDRATDVSVEVRAIGANDEPAHVVDGYVVYPNAFGSGAHAIHRPSPAGTEDFVTYGRPEQGQTLSYRVRLGVGVRGLRLVTDTLEFLDQGGVPRIRVQRPYLVTADHSSVPAHLDVTDCNVDRSPLPPWGRTPLPNTSSECTVRVSWSGDVAYPVLIDPAWVATDQLSTPRSVHRATLLANGRVLLSGGFSTPGTTVLTSTDLYDPTSATWSPSGNLATPRFGHTETRLADGTVLVSGGFTAAFSPAGTSERYDPGTGAWSAAVTMTDLRGSHSATQLADGRVLAAGGFNGGDELTSAEIYDPATNAWTATGSLTNKRRFHGASLLANGKVLVSGGLINSNVNEIALDSVEVFDPTAGTWSAGPSMLAPHQGHHQTILGDGRIVISDLAAPGTEILDSPYAGPWRSTASGNFLATGFFAALVAGDRLVETDRNTGNTLVFAPSTETWATAGVLSPLRNFHTATTLQDGRTVLTAGGTLCTFSGGSYSCAGGFTDLSALYDAGPAGGCSGGFADCDANPANGCEDPLTTVVSCGSCGNECLLFKAVEACTAGVCTIGSCETGFTDCDGDPSNGCEVAANPTCSPALADTDHDGFLDSEEVAGGGVDSNNDGSPDVDIAALGASPTVKDIFVEVDYMNTPSTIPNQAAIRDVIQAFANRGINLHVDLGTAASGTDLDLGGGNVVPTVDYLDFSDTRPGTTASGFSFADFDDVKAVHFNPLRRGVFHYMIYGNAVAAFTEPLGQASMPGDTEIPISLNLALFLTPFGTGEIDGDRFTYTGRTFSPPKLTGVTGLDVAHAAGVRLSALSSTSGRSEVFGNDIMVSKALWGPTGQTQDQESGTFMHELGHNLDLRHGGATNEAYKPNYLSVMNYLFQTLHVPRFSSFDPTNGCQVASTRLDYSGELLPRLVESALAEQQGIRDGADDTIYDCPSGISACGDGDAPIDWNCDKDTNDICGVGGAPACNVNTGDGSSSDDVLIGYDDWRMMRLDFRRSSAFADGAPRVLLPDPELDFTTASRLQAPVALFRVDVKPGSALAPINPKTNAKVPVAILASDGFDPLTAIDRNTVTFGRRGDEVAAQRCSETDVDNDGDLDLLCDFPVKDAGFDAQSKFANVRAKTHSGGFVGGFDSIKIVP